MYQCVCRAMQSSHVCTYMRHVLQCVCVTKSMYVHYYETSSINVSSRSLLRWPKHFQFRSLTALRRTCTLSHSYSIAVLLHAMYAVCTVCTVGRERKVENYYTVHRYTLCSRECARIQMKIQNIFAVAKKSQSTYTYGRRENKNRE